MIINDVKETNVKKFTKVTPLLHQYIYVYVSAILNDFFLSGKALDKTRYTNVSFTLPSF